MRSFNTNKKENGFSVIEVLITLFMIGVALVLFQATGNAVVLNKYGRYKEVAMRIADQKLQTVRNTSFNSIPSTGSFSAPLLSGLPNGQATLTNTTVTSGMKNIVVTITWASPQNGSTQQIELETNVTNRGLGQ